MRWWRKRRREPVARDALGLIVRFGEWSAEGVTRVIESHGFAYDAVVEQAESAATAHVNQHTDLSPRRRQRMYDTCVKVFILAFALALEAKGER